MRAYIINLGDEDARNVKVRLAQSRLTWVITCLPKAWCRLFPKRSEAIGVLPVTGRWSVWVGQWIDGN